MEAANSDTVCLSCCRRQWLY